MVQIGHTSIMYSVSNKRIDTEMTVGIGIILLTAMYRIAAIRSLLKLSSNEAVWCPGALFVASGFPNSF